MSTKTPFTRYRHVTLLVKNVSTVHTVPVELYRVLVLRSHNVGFEFVCFSYLKFQPLLLTIFIACHEDVRLPATQLVVLILTVKACSNESNIIQHCWPNNVA